MKELYDNIECVINEPLLDYPDFLELSKKWASFSLNTYKDELLTKALFIAKALAEFDLELKVK